MIEYLKGMPSARIKELHHELHSRQIPHDCDEFNRLEAEASEAENRISEVVKRARLEVNNIHIVNSNDLSMN